MKKYIVTSEYPEIKEGVIFKEGNGGEYTTKTNTLCIYDHDLEGLIQKGWIKEYKKEPKVNVYDYNLTGQSILFKFKISDYGDIGKLKKAIIKYLKSIEGEL